jgi:hypothetical protein
MFGPSLIGTELFQAVSSGKALALVEQVVLQEPARLQSAENLFYVTKRAERLRSRVVRWVCHLTPQCSSSRSR